MIGLVTAQRATTNSKVVLPTVHLGPLLANRLQRKDYANRLLLHLCFERPMLENYVDVIEASKILDVHPETVKSLIREGKLTATKFWNKWVMQLERLRVFANTYDGRRGRTRRLL